MNNLTVERAGIVQEAPEYYKLIQEGRYLLMYKGFLVVVQGNGTDLLDDEMEIIAMNGPRLEHIGEMLYIRVCEIGQSILLNYDQKVILEIRQGYYIEPAKYLSEVSDEYISNLITKINKRIVFRY